MPLPAQRLVSGPSHTNCPPHLLPRPTATLRARMGAQTPFDRPRLVGTTTSSPRPTRRSASTLRSTSGSTGRARPRASSTGRPARAPSLWTGCRRYWRRRRRTSYEQRLWPYELLRCQSHAAYCCLGLLLVVLRPDESQTRLRQCWHVLYCFRLILIFVPRK